MLRLASARTPGSKRFDPVRRAASMSIVPTTRSSEALIGSSTTRMRRLCEGSTPADLRRSRQSAHSASTSDGSQPKWQPSTTLCSGRSLASARTAVDLPVPFSPRMRTPPIVGTIAFKIRASFIDSWPTIAVKGKLCRSSVTLTRSRIGGEPSEPTPSLTLPLKGKGKLAWDQLLHELAFLDELLGGDPEPLLGIVVVLQPRHHLPVAAVRAHREAELTPFGHVVLTMAYDRQRVPIAPRRRRADALDRIDHGFGG